MSEEESLSRATLAPMAELSWPSNFAATAVHARTGNFRVFREGDGVSLQPAVAASAALPGVYPPITVDGEQCVDGGLRSMVNADLTTGYDAVTVVSCFPLEPPDEVDLEMLRQRGADVLTVAPDARLLGTNMLDQQLVGWAYDVGLNQAAAESNRLAEGSWA